MIQIDQSSTRQIVVAVSGYFNPLHQGHIAMFREAKKLGDKLIVIINSDKQREIKGSQEFMDEKERKLIVDAIRYVDESIISIDEDKTVCKTLKMVKPDIFANGGDRKNVNDIPEAEICQRNNIEMVFNVGGGKIQSSSWLLSSTPLVKTAVEEIPNLPEKKVIIADVDETICESCRQISAKMAEQINHLIKKGYQFAFISGTKKDDLLQMVSSRITEEHHLLATSGTDYSVVNNDRLKGVYNHSFTAEEKKDILAAFEKLIAYFDIKSMTTKEDQLQDRDSQITLSAIGRHAPPELKQIYDPDGKKRKIWINFLRNHLDANRFDLKIGGTTSLDITRKGLDKGWGIQEFAQHHNFHLKQILFFGDKIYPGGNDYPASEIVDCISVKNPEETLRELKKLP